jgi:hypothetical protein
MLNNDNYYYDSDNHDDEYDDEYGENGRGLCFDDSNSVFF